MKSDVKRKLLAGLFVPVFGLAAGTVLGQASPGGASSTTGMSSATGSAWNAQTFDLLDKNKDGRISREEAQADPMLKDAWSKLDASNRGSVSKDEFERFRTSQAAGASATPSSPPSSSTPPSTTTPPASGGAAPK